MTRRGHIAGTSPPEVIASADGEGRTLAGHATLPRLLSLEDTARYLTLSVWTVRQLEWSGVLARVRVPDGRGGELRKILFDRHELDRLIERWKGNGA